MNKIITILISVLLAADSFATLIISNTAATTLTTTSMYFNATVASTNGTGTNPTCTVFYGTVDYTTNANSWAFSNVFGVAGVGNISTQITGLSASHKYYFAWRAVEGASTDWATPSLNTWTKPTAPTSTPAVVTISLQTDTNGLLKAPTNFWTANKTNIVAMIGAATGTPIYAETDPVATNLVVVASNYFEAAKVSTNGSGAGLTGITAAQVGALTTNGNASALTNFPASVVLTNNAKLLAALTNETYLGTITGATIAAGSSDGVIVTGPNVAFTWDTNAAGGGGTGTLTNETLWEAASNKVVYTNNVNLFTTAEKAIATNPPSTNGLASTNWVVSQGYLTNATGDNLGNHIATQQVTWIEIASILTNLTMTSTNANPANVVGVYTQIADGADGPRWYNTNGYYNWLAPSLTTRAIGLVGSGTASGDIWYKNGTNNPVGEYTPLGATTGTVTVAYSYVTNLATWRAGWDGTNWQVTRDGVMQFNATNVYPKNWGMSVSGQVANLNGATGSLNTAVGNLNGSTGALNTAVGNLNGATSTLNSVTGSLNTAVNNLNGATNTLNSVTGSLNTAVSALNGATNSLNLNKLDKTATNTLAVTALTVTGGSPTNTAILVPTNSSGQLGYVVLPKVDAWPSAQAFTASGAEVAFVNTNYVVGGTWEGTHWTPGIGEVSINTFLLFLNAKFADGASAQIILYQNENLFLYAPLVGKVAGKNFAIQGTWLFYNSISTNQYSIWFTPTVSCTNFAGSSGYFQGAVLP